MSYPAMTVAHAFVSFCNEHGDLVTNLKLQKLLYYAQGWYLALRGETLFPEQLEAWVHGPVCKEVYQECKIFGHKPIIWEDDLNSFSAELVEHVKDVWEAYGQFSAFDLEQLTHQETPWKEARKGLASDAPSTNAIDLGVMEKFFKEVLARG
jgi:uncharacterized phage-associated protein